VVAGVLCTGLSPAAVAQGGPATVGVATVKKVAITDTRPVIGQFVAAVEADVATRTNGIVAEVAVEIGEDVAKDQVLVRLDTTQLELERQTIAAEVEVAEAGIRVAQAEAKRVEQRFERQAALRDSRAFSRSNYEDLQQDVARANGALARTRAQLQQAQAKLAQVDYRMRHSKIVAPFDGAILTLPAQPGAYMTVGSTAARMLDTDRLEIEADVPSDLMAGLSLGRTLPARFDDDVEVTATVRALVPVQDVATRTRPVRLTVDLMGLERRYLARGHSVTLQVPASAPRSGLAVPKDALVQSGTGWIVYEVEDGKAQPRPVDLGQSVAERIEVLRGLDEGDVVVVRGNERLRPGQSVAPASDSGRS